MIGLGGASGRVSTKYQFVCPEGVCDTGDVRLNSRRDGVTVTSTGSAAGANKNYNRKTRKETVERAVKQRSWCRADVSKTLKNEQVGGSNGRQCGSLEVASASEP